MRIDKFEKWLKQHGAEILPLANEYEAIRFKGLQVGVVYKSGKFSGQYAEEAWRAYKGKNSWDGRPARVGRKNSYIKHKVHLLKRDGDDCFFCCKPLEDDVTVEHLIPLASGGKNELSNMVLAHEECNQRMGHKTIVEKVMESVKNRMELLTKTIKYENKRD